MHRRTWMGAGLGIGARAALPSLTLAIAGCEAPPAGTVLDGATMGTGYQVKLAARVGGSDLADVRAQVDAALASVDAAMSTYRPHSELSRLNTTPAGQWLAVSAQTRDVIARALDVWRRSAGAFDVSVGPLVELWGFGPAGTPEQVPGPDAVARAQRRVGLAGLELAPGTPAVRKAHGHTHLDLSGIAKGYALDGVAARLDALGFDGWLVEVGGELRACGTRPDGAPWRVGIEQPVAGRRSVQRVVELGDRAIATSGDYRNFFEQGALRYSHTIDPRTGWPVRHDLAAVSVIADDAMSADAHATAILVLGAVAGLEYAEREGIAAHLTVRTAQRLREHVSAAMRPHLVA